MIKDNKFHGRVINPSFFVITISTVIIFLVMILYYSILKDYKKSDALNTEKKSISLNNILIIFKERNFKYMIPMSLMSYSSLVVILGLWGAPYLKDVHGLDNIERGKILTNRGICPCFPASPSPSISKRSCFSSPSCWSCPVGLWQKKMHSGRTSSL